LKQFRADCTRKDDWMCPSRPWLTALRGGRRLACGRAGEPPAPTREREPEISWTCASIGNLSRAGVRRIRWTARLFSSRARRPSHVVAAGTVFTRPIISPVSCVISRNTASGGLDSSSEGHQVVARGIYDYGIGCLPLCCELDPGNLIYRQDLRPATQTAQVQETKCAARID